MFLSIIYIALVLFLVVLVLLQPPGSDGLSGFGGTQQGFDSMFKVGSSSNVISKTTGVVAALFIISTLLLVGINARDLNKRSIANKIASETAKNQNISEDNNKNSVPFNN